MGVCKIARWFKTTVRSDRSVQSTSSMIQSSNEYYRNLLQQFANNCQTSNGDITDSDWIVYLAKEQNVERSSKKVRNRKLRKGTQLVPGVPHIRASEIFEIGCLAGTKDRHIELVSAEWHNTKVTLKRHHTPACRDAIKMDMEVLSEIRHPNILLLMATTYTDEYGLVSIFESVDCTLYNYLHEQGERMNIQEIIQIGIKLADALKYCHMRGYIHGAINSHCVYFTSNTTVKLGGWELARETENIYVEYDYERHLRDENVKWEAPEMSYGLHPSEKSDVYCLMLLIWEMCTGCVPWSGLDQSNIERQFMMRKRDVLINFQTIPLFSSIPSNLRNLIEAGLQPDDAKRTLDMDKIGRKLHRLLMTFEKGKDGMTTEHESNNNVPPCNDALHKKASPVLSARNKALKDKIKKTFGSKSHRTKIEEKSFNQFLKFKKEQCSGDLDSKNNIAKTVASAVNESIISPVTKVEITTPCTRCAEISNIIQDIDEKNNARANIKRLKELIASKREDFFYGNDSTFSSPTTSPRATSTLLQENNLSYVPCKPANHTTAIEPKYNKSPKYIEGIIPYKSPCALERKTPYFNMPANIKHAVMQPQILHSNTESFYESTLWRKEKEICLSRMGRDNTEYRKGLLSAQLTNNNVISTTDNDILQCIKLDSGDTNTTFTIESIAHDDYTEDTKESSSRGVDNSLVSTKASISSNKSIRNLKDALDRATEIVCSVTPSKTCNSEFNNNNMQDYKTIYEDMTKYDNQEIKIIERSTFDNNSFLEMYKSTENNPENSIDNSTEAVPEYNEILNEAFINSEILNLTATKTLNESQMLAWDQHLISSQQKNENKVAFTNKITLFPQARQDVNPDERKYVNVGVNLNNIATNDELRRCSLPTRLNNMTMMFPTKITCKGDVDNCQYTLDDPYIDDGFGSVLNCNLLLLDDHMHLLDAAKYGNENLHQTTEL